jgi:hypothetical protein
MLTHRLLMASLLVGAAACASGSATPSSSSPAATPSSAAKTNPDVITAEELADPSVSDGDAMLAVRRLRPRFLATRGTTSVQNRSAGSVHVSVNGGALQALSQLSQMRVSEIFEIRYLSPSDAAQHFGTASGGGGVISVKTK